MQVPSATAVSFCVATVIKHVTSVIKHAIDGKGRWWHLIVIFTAIVVLLVGGFAVVWWLVNAVPVHTLPHSSPLPVGRPHVKIMQWDVSST